MKLVGVFFFLLLEIQLFGRYCYSIETTVDRNTPVTPLYQEEVYQAPQCSIDDKTYLFSTKRAFVGCYKTQKEAQKVLQTSSFAFKDPKIIHHKLKRSDVFVIFPKEARLQKQKMLQTLQTLQERYDIQKIQSEFPQRFWGYGIDIIPIRSITFLPFINIYTYYKDAKEIGLNDKVLILYDGVYSIETLYKKLHNEHYISKIDEKTYEIKIPIVVSSTAKLVIQNKTIHLQAKPKSVFIFYYGDLYLKNSKFYAWDMQNDRYFKREPIPKEKALLFDYEARRPYFTGLAGSKTVFVDNIFKGLGFHSISATFGLSTLYFPSKEKYFAPNKALNFLLSTYGKPTGMYIGNDVFDGSMAFYTNGAKDIVYLGNYTHDNHIYNFDPHDYSQNLVIAHNLATKAQLAHGIIISRGVDNSIIANNITINNHSAGIMIDRTSDHNLIYKNISLANGFMGVSIQESNDILIEDNIIALNKINGIMSRNSLDVSIVSNTIMNNGKNGIEITSQNIDDTMGRDFLRDPYPKASSAVIKQNHFYNNYRNHILVKNSAAVSLYKNDLKDFVQFAGDLNPFNGLIEKEKPFTLYGRGFPFKAQSYDLRKLSYPVFNEAIAIYKDMQGSNPSVVTDMAIVYLKRNQVKKAKEVLLHSSGSLSKSLLKYLGYLYLLDAKKSGYSNKEKTLEGLTLIIEDLILQNPQSSDLKKLIYFIPNGKRLLQEAFERAQANMQDGRIFAKESYEKSELVKRYFTKEQRKKVRYMNTLVRYKMDLAGAKDFIEYLSLLHKNFTILTPAYMRALKYRIDKHNILQDKVVLHNQQKRSIYMQDKMCRRKDQENIYYQKQTDAALQNERDHQLEMIKTQLEAALEGINNFRVRKLSIEDIYQQFYKQRDNDEN